MKADSKILNDCKRKQTYLSCHKSTIKGGDVCCNKFYEKIGHFSQMVRIAERLNCIEFIEQPDQEKLMPFIETHKR